MNKRTREIVLWLLEKKQYQQTCNIAELMRKFKVSERTIRYDLDEIVDFLLAINVNHYSLKIMVKLN